MPAHWRQFLRNLLHDRWLQVVLLLGLLDLAFHLPRLWGAAAAPGAGLLQFAFYAALLALLVRTAARMLPRFMWAVRNRLLVTFFFLAVIPVLLTLALFGIATYIFYGQYSVYLLSHEFQARIEKVKDANNMVVAALRQPSRPATLVSRDISYYDHSVFPTGDVVAYYYNAAGRPLESGAPPLPGWLHQPFRGILTLSSGFFVAAYHPLYRATGRRAPGLLTLLPIDRAFMARMTRDLGRVQLLTAKLTLRTGKGSTQVIVTRGGAEATAGGSDRGRRRLDFPAGGVKLAPAANWLDLRIYFPARLQVVDGTNGAQMPLLLSVETRPSVLNRHLFSAMNLNTGAGSNLPLSFLAGVGIVFLVFELLSLLFGLRLTRSITAAISDLYVGTEHIHRGDFDYRISVASHDQLAALEASFNTMASSIRRLLREEQEKLRLENDLNIAQEVQAQLFPRQLPRVRGLELAGRCLPARSVSGDYFDFIPLADGSREAEARLLALALGDVSGKGISSALLMASVSSAIRAYQTLPDALEQALAAAQPAGRGRDDAPNGAAQARIVNSYAAAARSDAAPGALLERLNRQVYLGTPPEKYVTLFYAVYDAATNLLVYSNAGHPPPVVLNDQGRRRLASGGTVVGLFPEVRYEQESFSLSPGNLLAVWSDGLTEPENEYGMEFGEERLMELLERHRQRPLTEISDLLLRSVREWSGEQEQPDDATLILVRVV